MKVPVLLPKIFNHPFTYINNSRKIKNLNQGDIVIVPFGKKKEIGVVWPGKNNDLKHIKIKNINKKIDHLSLDQNLINFINWFAVYNMMPLGLVLKMVIGNKLNFIDKIGKDIKQVKHNVKKFYLNDEQKNALKFSFRLVFY